MTSIHSGLLKSQIQLLIIIFVFSTLITTQLVFAEVFIVPREYVGYFDSNGIYTVVGNIKNENEFAVIPTISVSVIDDSKTFSKTLQHVPLTSGEQIPFKIKFPEVLGNTPVLMPAELTLEKTKKNATSIKVLYDKTLIKFGDGHLTGRIQNTGNSTIYFPKVYAVIHGYEKVLDVVQNIELINKIDPGEIVDFSMYRDPSIIEEVSYYSCFAPVDTTVIPITAKKNGGNFDFRYDSGAWYSAPKFNVEGTILTLRGYNR
jgi:hypothetical protein